MLGYPARWLRQTYEHAFLVAAYWEVEFKPDLQGEFRWDSASIAQGTSFVIEAGWTGVTLAELEPRLGYCDFVRPRYTDEQRCEGMLLARVIREALQAACRRERYSYGNLLRLAWQRLILRRKPPALAAAAVICTQGVAQWWRRAGFDPAPGIADWAILPDDFWRSPAVERLSLKEGRWTE